MASEVLPKRWATNDAAKNEKPVQFFLPGFPYLTSVAFNAFTQLPICMVALSAVIFVYKSIYFSCIRPT
jgi:hypothetical protein